MASLGDLTLFISAETERAQRDIKGLGQEADKVVSKKREFDFDINKARNGIRDFKRDIKTVGEAFKTAYKVAKMEGSPIDEEIESAEILVKKIKQIGPAINTARKPGELLRSTFEGISQGTVRIVSGLAKIGFALYGLQQIAGVLNQAFGGIFRATVGQAVRLQESILKTQTALVSSNDVLRANGERITDPYEAIVALTGTIEKRIQSIRDRSLDLAGVTSQEVIEVFGIVAQQAGQIGASLEEAEDLAIDFAAALGTFGLPIYQARQEIGSILRGDITQDSYLAKSLGITPDDVAKAKNSTEGIVGFIKKKLEAAVAGQAIAAKSFSGVASNIRDFFELLGERIGAPLVQPIVDGLTSVYNLLVSIKDVAFEAANALGGTVGGALTTLGGLTAGKARTVQKSDAGSDTNKTALGVQKLQANIDAFVARIQTAFSNFALLVGRTIKALTDAVGALAAAFVGINVGVFETLLQTFANLLAINQGLIQGVSDLVSLYADFLKLPLVQTVANIGAQFKLMEAIGVNALIKISVVAVGLTANFASLKAMVLGAFGALKSLAIGALTLFASGLGAIQAIMMPFVASLGAANPQLGLFVKNLQATAVSANAAAKGLKTTAGATAFLSKQVVRFLKFNIILAAVTLAVAGVIEVFNKFRREADKTEKIKQFDDNIEKLNTTLSKTAVKGDAAKEALRSVADAQAGAAVRLLRKDFIEASDKVSKLSDNVERLKKEAKEANFLVALLFDPAGSARRDQTRLKNATADLEKARKAYADKVAKYEATKDAERLKEEVTTRSKELGRLNEKLAKQQLDLNRKVAQDKFNAEMRLADVQLELARSLVQERIEEQENRNRKLIEGEEGASAAALEGLIQYARTRKEKEADVENLRHQNTLAIQKLENELENYKFSMGQRVLDLKKAGADIDRKAAEYVQKVYEQIHAQRQVTATAEANTSNLTPPPVGGVSNARVGNTGRSTGPHIDIRGPVEQKVFDDAFALIKAWQKIGVQYIQLSNIEKDVKNITDDRLLSQLIKQEIEAHGQRVPVGTFAADIAVPEGTIIPGASPVSKQQMGAAGHTSRLPSGNRILHLQDPGSVAPDSAALQEALNNKVEPPDLTPYTEARREAQTVLESIQDSQQRLAAIANDRQLQDAIKRLVPTAAIDQFDDAIKKARALGDAMKETDDPERAEIIADLASKKAIAERELGQFLEKNAEIFADDAVMREQVAAQAREAVDAGIERFEEERTIRLEALEIEKNIAIARQLAADTKSGALRTDQALVTGEANLLAGVEYSPFDRRRIQAEGNIEARRMQDEDAFGGPLTGDALEKFEQFQEQELINAEKMAQLDAMTEKFQLLGDVAAGVGNSISTAFTQGFADILSGSASVQDVLGNMFQGIADSFMQMAQKIIADMIKMLIYKSLLGLFGGGQSGGAGAMFGGLFGGGGGGGAPMFGDGAGSFEVAGATPKTMGMSFFAKGGIVNGPTAAMIGEGGMNEAVVPLPNGKAIPVDFGKGGKMGGDVTSNVTVNVDSGGGSSSEMSGDEAGKLGKAIDNAVKRVIMEERRSGGMLHNGRR